MHALRPGGVRIPRGFKDSRTVVALEYRRYVLALLDRLGPLPRAADPMVREAGLLVVELGRLAEDLERARGRRRQREAARARRGLFMSREQLMRLELRLEELAARQPRPSLAQVMARVGPEGVA